MLLCLEVGGVEEQSDFADTRGRVKKPNRRGRWERDQNWPV